MSDSGLNAPLIDGVIDSGAHDVLEKDSPIAAESWASDLLAVFDAARLRARLSYYELPPFEEVILKRCAERRDQDGLVVAASLATVVPSPLDEQARGVLEELRQADVTGPVWLDVLGQAVSTRAWIASDIFGDQDSLLIGFSLPGTPSEHALAVLIDHNLSGQTKDAWISYDLDEISVVWESNDDPRLHVEKASVEEALTRLQKAMTISDLHGRDTAVRTEEFAGCRALIWARLRRAGYGQDAAHADSTEVSPLEREAIVAEFLSSAQGRAVRHELDGIDVGLLARYLVDLRCDHEGRPLRWSPNVVGMLLVELAPRKLVLDLDQAVALPVVLRAFVRFATDRTGLDTTLVDEILATVDEAEPRFFKQVGDPTTADPAKIALAALAAQGVSLDDPDALNAALEDLISMELPRSMPRSVSKPAPAPKPRKKPVTAPAEVVDAAGRAPIFGRFATLVDFYGEGRKLTQTGQPTLADARALVDLLGTDDRFDETIGDHTFKTKSALELPELGFTIRWAIAAGALRKERSKLRATATWCKLDGKPLKQWLKAVEALPSLGPLSTFYAHNAYCHRDLHRFLDELVPDLLLTLRSEAVSFDVALDAICKRADVLYEWLIPSMQDSEKRRISIDFDLDRLVAILGWASIVERVGATVEPDQWDATRQRLVGGTLQLTPLGHWWLGGGNQ